MAKILKAQAAGPQDRSSLFRSTRPSTSTAPAQASGVPGLGTIPGAAEQRAKLESHLQARGSIQWQSQSLLASATKLASNFGLRLVQLGASAWPHSQSNPPTLSRPTADC